MIRYRKFRFFIVISALFLFNLKGYPSIKSDNPVKTYYEWVEWVKIKNWDRVYTFFSTRFIEVMAESYRVLKNNSTGMKLFLLESNVKNPHITYFSDFKKMLFYIFENSTKYIQFFKDVEKPIKRVFVDYFDKQDNLLHDDLLLSLDKIKFNEVRKLRLYLESDARPYIRFDKFGWYIDPR